MKGGNVDWYPRKLAEQDEMYRNVAIKIDSYKPKYNLGDEYYDEVKLICAAFGAAYQSLMQIRATKKQMEGWFDNLLNNRDSNSVVTSVPTFQAFSLPAGTFIGLKKRFRQLIGLLKSQPNYTRADGEGLMIVAPQVESKNFDDAAPRLKIMIDEAGKATFSYKRGKFGGIEIQWRRVGETVWQFAEKTTEIKAFFTPPMSAEAIIEKFEFRAIYLVKNRRVGKWSPIYTKIVG